MATARDTPTFHRRYFILHVTHIVFQFLSLFKRSHCFSILCCFSPTHPPCFCISSRQGRWQRGLFLLIFLEFIFRVFGPDVEINFSLGQKQTVLLMCGLQGQFYMHVSMAMSPKQHFCAQNPQYSSTYRLRGRP